MVAPRAAPDSPPLTVRPTTPGRLGTAAAIVVSFSESGGSLSDLRSARSLGLKLTSGAPVVLPPEPRRVDRSKAAELAVIGDPGEMGALSPLFPSPSSRAGVGGPVASASRFRRSDSSLADPRFFLRLRRGCSSWVFPRVPTRVRGFPKASTGPAIILPGCSPGPPFCYLRLAAKSVDA